MSSNPLKSLDKEPLTELLSLFEKIARELLLSKDNQQLFDHIIDYAMELTSSDGGSLYLRKGNNHITFQVCKNLSFDQEMSPGDISLDTESIATYCFKNKSSIRIDDVYLLGSDSEYKFNNALDEHKNYRTKSMAVTPIVDSTGQSLGVIQLLNKKNFLHEPWDGEKSSDMPDYNAVDTEILERFARLVGAALENSIDW